MSLIEVQQQQQRKLENLLNQLQKVDKEGEEVLTKLATMKIIPTNAKPEQLHEEFKNLNLNKTLETIFYKLPKSVQDEMLHLAANLNFHSKGNQVKRGGGDDDIIPLDGAPRREPNIYLTKPFVTSVLVFIFGLFLLFTAKNMASSLGAEYGLEINFAGFVGLFLNPLQSAKGTFQVIVKSLLDKMSAELAFKIEEGCGAAGGGWINNLLAAVVGGPGDQFQCALDVGNQVMGAEMQVQQARILTNLNTITNLLRSGYAMIGLAGGNIVVMIDGRDGNINKFIKTIPGVTSVLSLIGTDQNQLAIEYGGGKRKSKKARKGKKSSKARKGKKTRKSKKARKA